MGALRAAYSRAFLVQAASILMYPYELHPGICQGDWWFQPWRNLVCKHHHKWDGKRMYSKPPSRSPQILNMYPKFSQWSQHNRGLCKHPNFPNHPNSPSDLKDVPTSSWLPLSQCGRSGPSPPRRLLNAPRHPRPRGTPQAAAGPGTLARRKGLPQSSAKLHGMVVSWWFH
jgi:hypothetical protein